MTGSKRRSLSSGLEGLGIDCVFGLPGTQNIEFFDDLRRSKIRTVLATSELAASFMAVGYARASGKVGVLSTIPGPGFTYAIPGLAEARLDSVPLLYLVVQGSPPPGSQFRHQEIPYRPIASPLVKGILELGPDTETQGVLARAVEMATSGEPGPVMVWVSPEPLPGDDFFSDRPGGVRGSGQEPQEADHRKRGAGAENSHSALASRLQASLRPVLFLGLGAVPAAEKVQGLAERLGAPFFTTPSARGIIPEDHPLCLGFDSDRGGLSVLNDLIEETDLILSLGCKFSHVGTGGFRLKLPRDRLAQVNTDRTALGSTYPAQILVEDSVERVATTLLASGAADLAKGAWSKVEIAEWRSRISVTDPGPPAEPSVAGVSSGLVRELIQILSDLLPRNAMVVTDSGLHQILIRRHIEVHSPRGLILPSDFQSMGFGLPAAIGASLADPHRKVVAVIGDGGLAMSGMEFLTLARERIPVTVIVFNDGHLNLVRLQQEREFGASHAVDLQNPDMRAFSDAVGVSYFRLDTEVEERLVEALKLPGPALVEVILGDSEELNSVRRAAKAKALARATFGDRIVDRLKRALRRG